MRKIICLFIAITILAGCSSSTPTPLNIPVADENLLPLNMGVAWSPNSNLIAFVRGLSNANSLWLIDLDAAQKFELVSMNGKSVTNPAWSSTGETIAFLSDSDGENDIWIINIKSGILSNITSDIDGDIVSYPAWSPDGKYLATITRKGAQENYVWLIAIESGDITNLTENKPMLYRTVSWSSDSQYLGVVAGNQNIYKINIGDKISQSISIDNVITEIAWSSNSNLIAFTGMDAVALKTNIWLLDGENSYQLTTMGGAYSPVWSNNDKKLAFLVGDNHLVSELWIINQDGSNLTQLTQSGDCLKSLTVEAWSSQNTYIAFTCIHENRSDIWVINADGSNPRNLTGG